MVFESFFGTFNLIFGALNIVLDPFINYLGPVLSILIIGIIISLTSTIAQKLFVDQDRLVYLQKEMKEFQQEMIEARKTNDPKALEKVQKKQMEFMSLQKEMMTMSLKPTIVTVIPFLIVFYWMAQNTVLNHIVVNLPTFAYYVLLVPLLHMIYPLSPGVTGNVIEWLGWYFLCSLGLSMVFRKLLGLKTAGMGGM